MNLKKHFPEDIFPMG